MTQLRMMNNRRWIWLVALAAVLLLPACGFRPQVSAAGEQEPIFLPPTLSPKITPSPILPTAGATEAVNCFDALSFQADLTIPDGTEVTASSTLDKQWQVLNSGSCNWGAGYEIRLVGGDAMGAETSQALPPTRSGNAATIRIQFTAPPEPGTYRSAWKAYTPGGIPFGDEIYIEIVVK